MQKIRNIGIIAHVDAGKTTITEQMLYAAGEVRTPGSVDGGTSSTDTLQVEQDRGISVRATTVRFTYQDTIFNLIDTPGHSDFAGEVERAMAALDGAVLVLSAAEGVEAQTTLLWNYLQELGIPTIIFINKIDRMTADVEGVIEVIQTELTDAAVVLQKPVHSATPEASIAPVVLDAQDETSTALLEKIVEHDDGLLNAYLDGTIPSPEQLHISLGASCRAAQLHPTLLGVAKNGIGITQLLAAVIDFLPQPQPAAGQPVAGVVYKIEHHAKLGKCAHVRLFAGTLKPRDSVINSTRQCEEKIHRILLPTCRGLQDAPALQAGDVAVVTGLKTAQTGDALGEWRSQSRPALAASPFAVEVTPTDATDYTALAEALGILSSEEPNLNFQWDRTERLLTLQVMGYIHIQILTQTLTDRFGLDATLSAPTIIYRETPSAEVTCGEAYTMPKPCWAVVDFLIKPGAPGSGIQYHSKVSVDAIATKYQRELEKAVPRALQQGPGGWEVTDIDITLIGGEDHEVHSRPGDFIIATHMALMQGLEKIGTTLLEPLLAYSITIEEDKCGRVMSDMLRMRGSYDPPVIRGSMARITGTVPAAEAMDYQITLSGISSGKSTFFTQFAGYAPCPEGHGVRRTYRGVNPLDRAKFILKMRGAITEGEK